MNRVSTSLTLAALMLFCTSGVQAGTIIKLSFAGSDSLSDIELVDGVLSTVDDGWGATTGDQLTDISYMSVLSRPAGFGSVTLDGIKLVGAPVGGVTGFALQATEEGSFSLYDPDNVLLLSGTLGNGTLSGPIGGTATGGFLTTEFGAFTGGSLMGALGDHKHTTLSISLSDVNNGEGMSLTDSDQLANFTADATANIGANAVPEPAAIGLLLIGAGVLCFTRRPARSVHGIRR